MLSNARSSRFAPGASRRRRLLGRNRVRGETPVLGTLPALSMDMLQSASFRRATLTVVGLACAGCGSPPKLDQQLQLLSSWTATLELARERHGAGAISATYATQLADAARASLQKTELQIGRAAHSRVDSSYAADALESLRGAIRRLDAETGR
jgi:hypothetical protein